MRIPCMGEEVSRSFAPLGRRLATSREAQFVPQKPWRKLVTQISLTNLYPTSPTAEFVCHNLSRCFRESATHWSYVSSPRRQEGGK